MTNNRITNTIAALFDEQPHADLAIENLVDAGITRSAITLSKGHGDDQAVVTEGPTGIWGILGSLFFPEDDQHVYAEGLRRGGYLVTVSGLTLDQKEAAANILDVEGSVDLDDRSESWRSDGWSSQGLGAASDTADFANSTYDRSDGTLVGGDIQDAFHSGRHDREVTAKKPIRLRPPLIRLSQWGSVIRTRGECAYVPTPLRHQRYHSNSAHRSPVEFAASSFDTAAWR
jgi:hypothetical protein